MEESYVQLYMGDGKGKTTAAIGLAARAAGQGLCVKFAQFLKGQESGEVTPLQKLGVELLRVSTCKKFFRDMTPDEKVQAREEARQALAVINRWLDSADLLILDEALGAIGCGILTAGEVLDIIRRRGGTEIVLTGRDAPEALLHAAHLVTEMREVKHYYAGGQPARRGIEY